ncbi:hypothetical protein L1987_59806 [Smallanthus sonchifolius]|uniref:Uncharacterized protein n=1 Tax=Smallanthus sonchifolius TaxID=185202 RepID=A0ACB9D6H9_9ASTR|nr:hypothetical protein L1987_59806 [Smallanthus sonchifolius]
MPTVVPGRKFPLIGLFETKEILPWAIPFCPSGDPIVLRRGKMDGVFSPMGKKVGAVGGGEDGMGAGVQSGVGQPWLRFDEEVSFIWCRIMSFSKWVLQIHIFIGDGRRWRWVLY